MHRFLNAPILNCADPERTDPECTAS